MLTPPVLEFFRRVLPRDHESGYGGWDRKDRVRQEAVDRAFIHPQRVPEFLFEMLEQPEPKAPGAATAEGE